MKTLEFNSIVFLHLGPHAARLTSTELSLNLKFNRFLFSLEIEFTLRCYLIYLKKFIMILFTHYPGDDGLNANGKTARLDFGDTIRQVD